MQAGTRDRAGARPQSYRGCLGSESYRGCLGSGPNFPPPPLPVRILLERNAPLDGRVPRVVEADLLAAAPCKSASRSPRRGLLLSDLARPSRWRPCWVMTARPVPRPPPTRADRCEAASRASGERRDAIRIVEVPNQREHTHLGPDSLKAAAAAIVASGRISDSWASSSATAP